MLASVFILTMGGGCCLFTVASLYPESFTLAASVITGIVVVFIVVAVLQRTGRLPSNSLSFLFVSHKNKRDDGTNNYLPRRVTDSRPMVQGTNRPISADEAHEIQVTSPNTWVPSPAKRKQKK
ncbi:MAG: hypothetical protein ACK58L_14000 [Planctomycetota bacterium]